MLINTINKLIDEENKFANGNELVSKDSLKNYEVFFIDRSNIERYDRINKYLTKDIWNQYKLDPEFLDCVYPGIKVRNSTNVLCAASQ
jgi:hypothetical protein